MEYQNLFEVYRCVVLDMETRFLRRYKPGAVIGEVDKGMGESYFVVDTEMFRIDVETW